MTVAAAGRRTAIVVLNYNGLDDTLLCLESIRPLAAQGVVVILVDNASRVDPRDAASAILPDMIYVRNAENLGYAGGNNRGIEKALQLGSDFVIVLNNDTTVHVDLVTALLALFEADPTLGIAGPVINFMGEPDLVMTDGVAFNPGPGTEFFKRIVVPVDGAAAPVVPVDIVNGCCMMVRADVFRRIGMFDETFFIVHEESDFCLRALRAGFGCAVVGRTLVWHKGSSAFVRSGRQLQRYFDARNLFFLIRRHAGRVSRSRGFWSTLPHYFAYCFYRHSIEREAGQAKAARAVAEGVRDALASRIGPYATAPRFGASMLDAAWSTVAAVVSRGRQL